MEDELLDFNELAKQYFTENSETLKLVLAFLEGAYGHIGNLDNAHGLTRNDVSLGRVPNLPIATPNNALRRRYNYAFTTPFTTHLAIADRFGEVNKDYVGLGSVVNYPVATEAISEEGTSNEHYITSFLTQHHFDKKTEHLKGEQGTSFFVGEKYQPMMLLPGIFVNRSPALVQGQAEMDQLKGFVESFENVFDEWLRISHQGDTYPAVPEELNEWSYNATEDQIVCTVNSTSFIGFISPERHGDYIFEVTVNSDDPDDDLIGICIGYVEKDGRQYTLTASRSCGGVAGGSDTDATLFLIEYNRGQSDYRDIASHNGGLIWGDGVVDDSRAKSFTGNTGNGWDKYPEGCRIRVERFGDVFTIKTSDLGSATYKESATVVIDINDYPELEKFRGPIQFGYVCQSQLNSTWSAHRRPVELGTIVDADTLETWTWDGEQFVLVTDPSAEELVPPNRLFFTEMTNKLYYHEPFKGIMKVSG